MNFENELQDHINKYLSFRNTMGFKAITERDQLKVFKKNVIIIGIFSIEQLAECYSQYADNYRKNGSSESTANGHFQVIYNFLTYLQRNEIAVSNSFSQRKNARIRFCSPHVFKPLEIKKILESFRQDIDQVTQWTHYYPRYTRHVMISILAYCGLRASEICNVRLGDFDYEAETLFIEKTKFSKDRQIPVPKKVLILVSDYLRVCESRGVIRKSEDYLFKPFKLEKYSRKTLGHFFNKKMNEMDLYFYNYVKGNVVFLSPSLHSLRHSFAVNTVQRWYRANLPVNSITDTLATYMGHYCYSYTQAYLKKLNNNPAPLLVRNQLFEE